MYSFLANLWKLFTHIFRVFQFLGAAYFILYIIYWLCAVGQASGIFIFSDFFKIPQEITYSILRLLNFRFSSEYSLLRFDILSSVFFTLIALLLYNLIFIPLDAVERFFVEKSFEKGEQDYN